jgi:Glycosyl transferase family 2
VKVPTLPIGVVIPSRNSLRYLPAHLQSVLTWAEMVEKIVVVDSNSTDGTVEYIREHLTHPNLHIFSRPPGLYASWNYGIGQLSTKYTYVCTVGESITPDGLRHLVETSERLGSDVCISPPQFLDMEGRILKGIRWPIHQIIQDLSVCEPHPLTRAEAVFYVLRGGGNSILGSSASNLYRTAVLQKNPFPTEYGSAGDTAWGLLNCCDVRFAVTPKSFSTFLFHPTSHQQDPKILMEKFRILGRTLFYKARSICDLSEFPELKILVELLDTTDRYRECKQALDLYRSRAAWVLNWRAWQARSERNRLRQRLKELKRQCRREPTLAGFIGRER